MLGIQARTSPSLCFGLAIRSVPICGTLRPAFRQPKCTIIGTKPFAALMQKAATEDFRKRYGRNFVISIIYL
jgi:hypothetical protein